MNEWLLLPKVIIEKSHGEVSLVEQDTIENVSKPIIFLTSFYTSHSAYVATETESNGAKIDGSF